MIGSLVEHWPEYAIEALLLAAFMMIACASVALVQHPGSAVRRRVRSPVARRFLIGFAMGLTAIALISSPLGRRSGAHLNPATTLSFLLLGKVKPWDAAFYMLAQFLGGFAGVAISSAAASRAVAHPSVGHVVTQPGGLGRRAEVTAFAAEALMTFILFLTVLLSSNNRVLSSFTPIFVGALVCLYITVEAPISGMSLNPARTLGSALVARRWRALWVYLTAPVLGMLLAAAVFASAAGESHVYCAKLDHSGDDPCIFNCRIAQMRAGR